MHALGAGHIGGQYQASPQGFHTGSHSALAVHDPSLGGLDVVAAAALARE